MNNTIQLYVDDEKQVKGFPLTSPDRVIDSNGKSIKDKLKNNVKFDVVGGGTNIPPIDGKYDDTELKNQIKNINTELSDARGGEEKVGITLRKISEKMDKNINDLKKVLTYRIFPSDEILNNMHMNETFEVKGFYSEGICQNAYIKKLPGVKML